MEEPVGLKEDQPSATESPSCDLQQQSDNPSSDLPPPSSPNQPSSPDTVHVPAQPSPTVPDTVPVPLESPLELPSLAQTHPIHTEPPTNPSLESSSTDSPSTNFPTPPSPTASTTEPSIDPSPTEPPIDSSPTESSTDLSPTCIDPSPTEISSVEPPKINPPLVEPSPSEPSPDDPSSAEPSSNDPSFSSSTESSQVYSSTSTVSRSSPASPSSPSSLPPSSPTVPIVPLQICRSYAKHGVCALPGTCIYDHPPHLAAPGTTPPSSNPSQAVSPSNAEATLAPTQAWEAAGQYFESAPPQECQTWMQTGTCPYGVTCQFSHPPLSVQYPPKYSIPNNQSQLHTQYPLREQPRGIHPQISQQLTQSVTQLMQAQQLPRITQQVPHQIPPQQLLQSQSLHSQSPLEHPQRVLESQQRLQSQYPPQITHKVSSPSPHTLDQPPLPSSQGNSASALSNKSAPKKLLCKNWNKGCKFGDTCRFYHPKPETTFDHLFKQPPPPPRLQDEDDYYDDGYDEDYPEYPSYNYVSNPKSMDFGMP